MKQATTRRKVKLQVAPSPFYQRIREGGLILLSSIAIYLLIALLTYNQADSAWSHSSTELVIHNAAGRTGAWLSDLLYSLFGCMAYLFPVALGLVGAYLYYDKKNQPSTPPLMWVMRVTGLSFTLLAGCGLITLHFTHSLRWLPMTTGGVIGELVQNMVLPYSSKIGSTLILGALFLVGVTLLTGFSWLVLFEKVARHVLKGFFVTYQNILKKPVSEEPLSTPSTVSAPSPVVAAAPARALEPEALPSDVKDFFAPKRAMKQPTRVNKILAVVPKTKKLLAGSLSLDLLDPPKPPQKQGYTPQQLQDLARLVESRLLEFGVVAKVVGVLPGPVITRFELELAAGIKVNKITGLAKDLARSLSVVSVRVVEVIPGKSVVGLEIPNVHRELVCLKEILDAPIYAHADSPVTLALGKDIAGHPVAVDLAKMPHLLVAGTTGSGKSVGLNAMLLSILYKATPEAVRLILIDPKMLELAVYDNIPHLLTPVITDMKDAANGLRWCVSEMERRYQLMAALGVRNITGYNQKVEAAREAKKPILDPLWHPQSQEKPQPLDKLPFIVVVVDEFADMMMVVGKKVEELIARIAQKARAAGIHLILATQRPSVDVITGLIKANIPTRIAFQVSSRIDSRTILDQSGAEQLLGHGDLLYLPPGVGVPHRIHGAFVSDNEVHKVADALRELGAPAYIENIVQSSVSSFGMQEGGEEEYDELYDQAVAIVTESRKASISLVQRRLKIGYNRAARLIEKMESEGVVSAMQSNGTREVIAPPVVEK